MPAVPTQDLVLLGLLMDRELHGYEIKQIVEEHMAQVAEIAPGTIYYTLKKLEKRGLVSHREDQSGNRPTRRVYAITAEGKKIFSDLLREALFVDERPYYVFDAALYFYRHMNKKDLLGAVDQKLAQLEEFRARLAGLQSRYPGRWPFPLEALKKKAELFSQAFEDWFLYLQRGTRRRMKGRRRAKAEVRA